MFTLNLLCGLAILICRVDFQVVAMHICVCCVIRAACLAVIEMPLRRPALNPRRGIPLILNTLISLWRAKCALCEACAPRGEKHTFTVRWSYSTAQHTHTHTHIQNVHTAQSESGGVDLFLYRFAQFWMGEKVYACAWWCEKSVNICAWWVCVICVCMRVETCE